MKTLSLKVFACVFAAAAVLAALASAQQNAAAPDAPRKIIGNVYTLGTASAPSFLVVTPQGDILINSGLERAVPQLQKSIEQLGFKISDVKIVLGTDARPEQMEADALLKQQTGAQVMAMAESVSALQNIKPGGKAHPLDRTLHDGDQVTLGGSILVAHLATGRTPGAANWAIKATDAGKLYDVALLGAGQQPAFMVAAAAPDPATVAVVVAAGANAVLVLRGKDRYHAYACFDCHGQNGEGTEDAPDLVGSHLTAEQVAAFLNKPSADALAKGMPVIPPNSPDLQPLVAYVLFLRKNP